MTKTRFILLFGFLTLLSLSSVRAQVNPVYQRMVKNGWRYPSAKGHPRLSPSEITSEYLKSLGYTDSTVADLKRAGVDVGELWKNRIFNTKVWTALSDCIVIGTVSKITYPPWARPWYHTLVHIQVDTFLKNDYSLPKGDIAVLEVSGPSGPHKMTSEIGEATLNNGEHVLLFLSAGALIANAANNNITKLYEKLINKSEIYFKIFAKYDIKSGEILSKTKKEGLKKVTDSVSSVLKVINHSVPTSR